MDDHANEKRIIGSFLIGGLVGAGLALLFAPQSGKKTRKDISRFTKNVAGDAKDLIEDATESVQEMVDRVSDKLSDLASSRKEITEDARKRFIKTLDNVQKLLEKQKEKLF
ncbi:MAG: YtxH domain-containing protein [Nitrospiraceae bacterium]|nr:MAG: YtxH domain-containing protein [Nitrospiraceae bacterium]